MNYRHAFHAGNFADLVKHAALLNLLMALKQGDEPLNVIDTHAGRGLYELQGPEARKTGEALAGVGRLMAAKDPPAEFAPLIEAVGSLNKGGALTRYPGSPWLIARALKPSDSYVACELRAEEHQALAEALRGRRNVRTLCADGYEVAARQTPRQGRVLVLIDPPYERGDDYARVAATTAAVRRRNPEAVLLIWAPLKDLATFDDFLGDFEDALRAPGLVAETRMRPLADPTKMNGCVLVIVGVAPTMSPMLEAICCWTAESLGEGGAAKVYALPG